MGSATEIPHDSWLHGWRRFESQHPLLAAMPPAAILVALTSTFVSLPLAAMAGVWTLFWRWWDWRPAGRRRRQHEARLSMPAEARGS